MNKEEIANFIGEKIKYYRKLNKWTQTELGEKIGMGKNAIGNYERGFRSPKKDTMFALANAFDISIDDLFPPIESAKPKQNITKVNFDPRQAILLSNYNKLNDNRKNKLVQTSEKLLAEEQGKVIDIKENRADYDARRRINLSVPGKVSAGTGYWQEDDYDTMVSFYADEIPDDSEYDTVAIVVGHSMEPKIKNGDFLFIKLKNQVDLNKIGIFQVNGENYVKKLKGNYLESLNKEYDDIQLSENDDIRTVGEVVGSYSEK